MVLTHGSGRGCELGTGRLLIDFFKEKSYTKIRNQEEEGGAK